MHKHVNDISEPLSRNKDNKKNMEDKTHKYCAYTCSVQSHILSFQLDWMDVKTHNMKTENLCRCHTSYQYYGVSSDGSGSSGYGSFAEGCGGRIPPTAPSSCSIPWVAGAGTGLPPASSSRTGSAVASARFVTDFDLTHCIRKEGMSTKVRTSDTENLTYSLLCLGYLMLMQATAWDIPTCTLSFTYENNSTKLYTDWDCGLLRCDITQLADRYQYSRQTYWFIHVFYHDDGSRKFFCNADMYWSIWCHFSVTFLLIATSTSNLSNCTLYQCSTRT